jgi:hypothetical protein
MKITTHNKTELKKSILYLSSRSCIVCNHEYEIASIFIYQLAQLYLIPGTYSTIRHYNKLVMSENVCFIHTADGS